MLKVGDRVQCRFYNTPDGKFYGELMNGEILGIYENCFPYVTEKNKKGYLVKFDNRQSPVGMHRKEIKRKL